MATPLTDAINALTAYANGITGKSDANLPDAVRSLADGFGGGSSVYSGTYTPSEDTLGPSFDIGGSNFSHFLVCATADPRESLNKKCFLFAYTTFGSVDEITLATNNSGATYTGGIFAYKWFGKSGSTVNCTNRQATNAGNTGYWVAGVTYYWAAW